MSRSSPNDQKQSLYDRLGGIFAIAAVVDYFSEAILDNDLVGRESPNPFLNDWSNNHLDRLPGLKWMRTLWLASLAGGPYQYVPTRPGRCPFGLEQAHAGLQITPREFDVVTRLLAESLQHFGVKPREAGEVLRAFVAHKSEVDGQVFCDAARRRCPA